MEGTAVQSVSHAGIVVEDIDAVGDFFEDALGMPRIYEHSTDGTRLRGFAVDDMLVELIQYPVDHPMRFRATGAARVHLGFSVVDLDRMHDRVLALGLDVLAPPRDMGPARLCFVRGPEDIVVELVEYGAGITRASQYFTDVLLAAPSE